MFTRGGGKAIVGARGVWSTGNEGTSANPLLPRATGRNPTRIRIVNRQVNDENIIIIPDENPKEMENFQDANDHGTFTLAGENNPIIDVSEGDNLGDDDLIDEDEDPMNYDEAMAVQGIRKRSRNQIDSDDEMNNGSTSVNGPVI